MSTEPYTHLHVSFIKHLEDYIGTTLKNSNTVHKNRIHDVFNNVIQIAQIVPSVQVPYCSLFGTFVIGSLCKRSGYLDSEPDKDGNPKDQNRHAIYVF